MCNDSSAAPALSFVLASVESLETSLQFYTEVIGLESGPITSTTCELATDTVSARPVRTALVGEAGTPVGRMLLVEFADRGTRIREPGDRLTRGCWNVNFYVDDIWASMRDLQRLGFEFWSEPETYVVGATAGAATEVVFEGPDGIAINLVSPLGEEGTETARTRSAAARHGKTRTGFTPVATTGMCVVDAEAATSFYRVVLGMRVVIDEIFVRPESNRFLVLPPDAINRVVFLAGDHHLGKVALNEPRNFEVAERVAAAHSPNIGYLAQGFDVPSLGRVISTLTAMQIPFERRAFPRVDGLDVKRCVQLRIPGSGAFAVLTDSGPDQK